MKFSENVDIMGQGIDNLTLNRYLIQILLSVWIQEFLEGSFIVARQFYLGIIQWLTFVHLSIYSSNGFTCQ